MRTRSQDDSGVSGLGFGVWGLGFGVKGFRVLGCGVSGIGSRGPHEPQNWGHTPCTTIIILGVGGGGAEIGQPHLIVMLASAWW